jgi:hypothetical protein
LDKISVIEGKCSFIRKVLEQEVEKSPFFKTIHNTVKDSDGDSRKVCVRSYRLCLKNEDTNFMVKFFYDYRNDIAKMYFDMVSEKALSHMVKGDFDPEKISEYMSKKNEAAHAH